MIVKGRSVVPLVAGGMGVNISSQELALAVAKVGGIGHISDAMSPFLSDQLYGTKFQAGKGKKFAESRNSKTKPGVIWDPEDVHKAQVAYVEDTMSKKTGDGAIFINVMEKLTMGNPKPTLAARLKGAMDAGIDGITLSAGLHLGTLSMAKDHPRFRDVMFGIIVSSARALKLFIHNANKVQRLPDYIVVEGPLAGGHLGFGLDWAQFSLMQIFLDVQAFLAEHKLNIPVIPAGGIFTGADANEFLSRGAAAVQVATRFTVSKECGLPDDVKQVYLRSKEDDVVVNLSSPTGYPMRMLKSSPSLRSNIKPNCESLGYLLDGNGDCAYHDAYEAGAVNEKGQKLPIENKMCICSHFMKHDCYTCGHNVFRLKDVVEKNPEGIYILPTAAEVFNDYVQGMFEADIAPDYASTLGDIGLRASVA